MLLHIHSLGGLSVKTELPLNDAHVKSGSLTSRQFESKEDRRERGRCGGRDCRKEEEEGQRCGLRCPRSPRGQKLWKRLCCSEKVKQRRERERNKQDKRTGNSEGRELSVTYWTNKLVCWQNGLRG